MMKTPRLCVSGGLAFLLALAGTSLLMSRGIPRWQLIMEDSKHPHAIDILSVAFTDPNRGWTLNALELWETKDGGATWETRLSGDDRAFYSLIFFNHNVGWIVGTKKENRRDKVLVVRTTDGGNTWLESPIDIATSSHVKGASGLQSVSFCDPDVGWAAGADLIVRSIDGGRTWQKQRSGNNEVFYGIQCVSPAQAWAVGQDGLILRTEDGGNSWFRQNGNTKATLARVRCFDGVGWIVGGLTQKGILLKTVDGGEKWEHVQVNTDNTLLDIHISDNQGWIIGTNGTILRSSDSGQTWQQEESPTSSNLINIFFLNQRQGWVGGSKLTLLRFSK